MTQEQCHARVKELQAQAMAAWAESNPARDFAKQNPNSAEAQAAAEAALQKAAHIAADNAQAAADLSRGPCDGKSREE
jgi:hypothetical protein